MPDDKNSALFAQLVVMFHGAGMQHLGKIKNPMTDAIERDLNQAQAMIDLLEMLEAKTKGNLGEQESSLLKHTLQELKLNYVDEASKQSDPKATQ